MPDVHAVLNASSSYRWINCTGSVRLVQQFPAGTSEYAEAGRLAHEIAEFKARSYFLDPIAKRSYSAKLNKYKKDPHYDPGMDAATDDYLDFLKSVAVSFETTPFIALETRVDYSDVAPEGFGTADCLIIGEGQLHVIDYKNGSGVPVEAEHNTQMQLYALGALQTYGAIFGDTIQQIHLHIVQPHAGGIKSWSLLRGELERWAENVAKPAAQLAIAGKGDFKPGPWCDKTFCPARAICTARARQMLSLEPLVNTEPELLTDDQIGDILTTAQFIDSWVDQLKAYALSAALQGRKISGFKVVEGRGSREWTSQDAAFTALEGRGVEEAMLWERKPVSVAGLEKILGKKAFSDLAADLVTKKPGKPALVPESDRRPEYNAAAIAFGGVSHD